MLYCAQNEGRRFSQCLDKFPPSVMFNYIFRIGTWAINSPGPTRLFPHRAAIRVGVRLYEIVCLADGDFAGHLSKCDANIYNLARPSKMEAGNLSVVMPRDRRWTLGGH